MGMLATLLSGLDTGEDMSRARPLDAAKVSKLTSDLQSAVGDVDAFSSVCDAIRDDESLTAAELIEIAHKLLGGTKPKSRKAALTAIGQERLRRVHAKAKATSASKARVW